VALRRPLLRAAVLAAAVLALLAVVAVASRAERPSRPGDPELRTLPIAFWDYVVTIGMLVMVLVFALALLLRVPLPESRRRGRFGLTQLLGLMLILGLVALAGTRMERPRGQTEEGNQAVPGQGVKAKQSAKQEASRRQDRSVEVQWPVLLVAGGVVLLGFGLYLARRQLAPKQLLGSIGAATALSEALDDSLDDLRAERDARRAVIAAYARMEGVLDRHGLPRRRSEAPLEYLARVLRELRVRSAAVLALTELFERAKFSRHRIDAEMKEEAIGALVAVRDDLEAVSR
jgi:uncharacterized protein DUF4129